jgi:RNA polymerase-binding protein DksA
VKKRAEHSAPSGGKSGSSRGGADKAASDRGRAKAKEPPRTKARSASSAKPRQPKHAPPANAGTVSRAKPIAPSHKQHFREMLLSTRERLQGQITALKSDSLVRNDDVNNGEDGSDFFERQFALNIVSTERDAVLDIDDALRRLDEGTYGFCEDCHKAVEVERLKALPFVRKCIHCQSATESGKPKFRPPLTIEEV